MRIKPPALKHLHLRFETSELAASDSVDAFVTVLCRCEYEQQKISTALPYSLTNIRQIMCRQKEAREILLTISDDGITGICVLRKELTLLDQLQHCRVLERCEFFGERKGRCACLI